MRKATILLAVTGLVLACSMVVYAGAQKILLVPTGAITAENGIHANANGFVIVNVTPEGATDATIQIQLRDGAPEYEYVVKSAGVVLGTFTTNKKGSGGLHINLAEEEVLGDYINIWTADEATRLLRAML